MFRTDRPTDVARDKDWLLIKRVWDAIDAHYSLTAALPLTLEMLEKRLARNPNDGPFSLSALYRMRKKYPKYLPWPVERGDRRPWADIHLFADAAPVEPKLEDCVVLHLFAMDDDGNPGRVDAVVDQEGRPIRLIWPKPAA